MGKIYKHKYWVQKNRYLLVTPDGSSYFSINSSDNSIAYDFGHVNASFKTIVINRYLLFHTLDSLNVIYNNVLSLPWAYEEV